MKSICLCVSVCVHDVTVMLLFIVKLFSALPIPSRAMLVWYHYDEINLNFLFKEEEEEEN